MTPPAPADGARGARRAAARRGLGDQPARRRARGRPRRPRAARRRRAAGRGGPGEYALVVEAVREGYLLHYGERPGRASAPTRTSPCSPATTSTRSGSSASPRSATWTAVRELSDLISLAAQIHDRSRAPEPRDARIGGALARQRDGDRGRGRRRPTSRRRPTLRARRPGRGRRLRAAARSAAAAGGLDGAAWTSAADAIDFRPDTLS